MKPQHQAKKGSAPPVKKQAPGHNATAADVKKQHAKKEKQLLTFKVGSTTVKSVEDLEKYAMPDDIEAAMDIALDVLPKLLSEELNESAIGEMLKKEFAEKFFATLVEKCVSEHVESVADKDPLLANLMELAQVVSDELQLVEIGARSGSGGMFFYNIEDDDFEAILDQQYDEDAEEAEEDDEEDIEDAEEAVEEEDEDDGLIPNVTTKAELNKAGAGKKAVLVDFFAEWCGPCQMMGPAVRTLAAMKEDDGLQVVQVNVDHAQELAEEFEIEAMPTFVMLKDGKTVDRLDGADIKALTKMVNKHA